MQSTSDSSTFDSNFSSMAYNEEQREDFTKILSWLSSRNNLITSIVDGERTDSFSSREKILIGDSTTAFIGLASEEVCEKTLDNLVLSDGQDGKSGRELGPDEILSRLERLKKVMDAVKVELCAAESIASWVPLWQVQELDQPTWTGSLPLYEIEDAPRDGNTLMLVRLHQREYSLEDLLIRCLFPALFSDRKFALALWTASPEDNACIIPIALLVEAVNEAKIRGNPIDLLLPGRAFLEGGRWETLLLSKQKTSASSLYIGGDLKLLQEHLPLRLAKGAFSTGLPQAKGSHYVVDSSADVATAIESIATHVWTGGSQVISAARSLLFVQQSVYEVVVEGLKKKLNRLTIQKEPTGRRADFIKQFPRSVATSMESLLLGAKVISAGSATCDFTYPSLVYDIGTSAPLVTTPESGSGHILIVIPYRSLSELVALANNFDLYNDTCIFASNISFVTAVAGKLKATSVQVNTTAAPADVVGRRRRFGQGGSDDGFAVVSGKINSEIWSSGKSWTDDKCRKSSLDSARAAHKTWAALPLAARTSAVERFLRQVITSDVGSSEEERLHVYGDLLKILGSVAGTAGSGGGGSVDGKNLHLKSSDPVGVVGILFVNLEVMNLGTRLLPLLMSTVKGNVGIVMSVSNPDPNNLLATMQNAAAASLPTGVVTFLQFPTMEDAKRWAFQQPEGRFNLLWVVQSSSGEESLSVSPQELSHISSCNRVIIDTELQPGTAVPHLERRLANLAIPKTIMF